METDPFPANKGQIVNILLYRVILFDLVLYVPSTVRVLYRVTL